MGHRHFSNSFNMLGPNQGHDRNHLSAERSYNSMGGAVAPENGSLVCPMHCNMLRGGVHCDSQCDLEGRVNEYSSSSFSREVQHRPLAFSGPPYDPFLHSSAAGNLYVAPEGNAGHMHCSYYNRQTIHDVEGGLLDPTTGGERVGFKRKSPGISGAYDRGSTNRFYGAGSSSGSSQMMLEKPTAEYQSIPPPGPTGLPQYRGSGLSIAGEDSLRNVRSRSRIDFDPNTTRTHLSNYPSRPYHETTVQTNHPATVNLSNFHVDAANREWNHIPCSAATHGRPPISDINGFCHETNRFSVRGSASSIGVSHHDSFPSRHPIPSSRHLYGPPSQAARESHGNNSRRAISSYRTGLSHSHVGHEVSSSDNGLYLHPQSFSSRYPRPSSAGGWRNSYRNGRSRIAIERFQSISNVVDANDRMGSEAHMMVDRSALYSGSRNLFDQYRDMRLDIDSMSYEELLALEESIGNVDTGLSEDMMSKCLMEKLYHSADQNHDEESCAICLEEYKNAEGVGTLKNCGHDYHVGCIRKWLLMKNVCPICKSAALPECSN